MKSKLSIAFFTYFAYLCLMAAGMYNLKYNYGSNYSSPLMPAYLLWFEIIMGILVFSVFLKYFKTNLKPFQPKSLSLVILLGYLIMVGNLLIMLYYIVTTGYFNPKYYKELIVISLSIILVGISEEVMFRGILLPEILARSNRLSAIILSAVCFSAFHLVNMIGGLPFSISIQQVFNTFLMGITFACFATEFGMILPGMILHVLLDFDLMIGSDTGAHLGNHVYFALNFNPWFGVFMLVFIAYKQLKNSNKNFIISN